VFRFSIAAHSTQSDAVPSGYTGGLHVSCLDGPDVQGSPSGLAHSRSRRAGGALDQAVESWLQGLSPGMIKQPSLCAMLGWSAESGRLEG
jgi:hypothetical protein